MPLQAAGQPVLLAGVPGKEALEHTATQTTQSGRMNQSGWSACFTLRVLCIDLVSHARHHTSAFVLSSLHNTVPPAPGSFVQLPVTVGRKVPLVPQVAVGLPA
jgi:hypothetical protein